HDKGPLFQRAANRRPIRQSKQSDHHRYLLAQCKRRLHSPILRHAQQSAARAPLDLNRESSLAKCHENSVHPVAIDETQAWTVLRRLGRPPRTFSSSNVHLRSSLRRSLVSSCIDYIPEPNTGIFPGSLPSYSQSIVSH